MDETRPLRIQLAHALREVSGMGLQDVLGVMRDAETNFAGDYVLAAYVRDSHALAVSVRSTDPDVTAEQARRTWDIDRGRSMRQTADDEWAEVERLSALVRNDTMTGPSTYEE